MCEGTTDSSVKGGPAICVPGVDNGTVTDEEDRAVNVAVLYRHQQGSSDHTMHTQVSTCHISSPKHTHARREKTHHAEHTKNIAQRENK